MFAEISSRFSSRDLYKTNKKLQRSLIYRVSCMRFLESFHAFDSVMVFLDVFCWTLVVAVVYVRLFSLIACACLRVRRACLSAVFHSFVGVVIVVLSCGGPSFVSLSRMCICILVYEIVQCLLPPELPSIPFSQTVFVRYLKTTVC